MRLSLSVVLVLVAALAAYAFNAGGDRPPPVPLVRLPGHVLPALAAAERVGSSAANESAGAANRLTVVLRRDDQSGFENYLHDVYDPASGQFRRFLSQREIAARFGPSQVAYDSVLRYLQGAGLELVSGSANRLTLTFKGSRTAVERAFAVELHDYRIGGTGFFANDADPALPAELARHVAAIAGLSDLARPQPAKKLLNFITAGLNCATCATNAKNFDDQACQTNLRAGNSYFYQYNVDYTSQGECKPAFPGAGVRPRLARRDSPRPAAASGLQAADGTGQTIGLLQFDTFEMTDVADFVEYYGLPASSVDNVSRVQVNGGAFAGANQDEVLLDIDTILVTAPGARIVVYDGPWTGSIAGFTDLFNAMVNDGVDIISNSWGACEDQVSRADAESIDAVLQNAAAAGISVFNASGDTGSTCLDGSPNTIGVPSDSPHATAVGGSSLSSAPGPTYGSETWWDGSDQQPPTGAGGFGVSRYFDRPAYQNGATKSARRSVPDVVANADPANGVMICQASGGGCPSGKFYGGTSMAAPAWAAYTALLNQAAGSPLGELNPQIYPLRKSDAFHDAASMNTDFAHVGLGSPNLNGLKASFTGQAPGVADAAGSRAYFAAENSGAGQIFPVPADGKTPLYVVVELHDANGNVVPGKRVSLQGSSGDSTIEPATAVTTVANGAAVFTVTSTKAEAVSFTATDVTDGVVLAANPATSFVTPPATSAGIQAFPATVAADGQSTTTLTVTLKDALERPTPGKTVTISQGGGHSQIKGPNPPVTDANGQIQFTATDLVNETVTYAAVDVSDGDLPIPGNPQVTFSGGTGLACGQTAPPSGAEGYAITPYISGFEAAPFFYGNVNWGGCPGGTLPAFDGDSVFVTNFKTGELFRLDGEGGAVSSGNRLSTLAQAILDPVVGKDGRLYSAFGAGPGGFSEGSIVELDRANGSILRTVADGLTCPGGLAIDPLSGDLFFNDRCFGGGADNPDVFRIANPASDAPSVTTYVTLPASPSGLMAFTPNGTLYVVVGYHNAPTAPVYRVSGTDSSPPALSQTGAVSDFSLAIGETLPNGDAKSLIVHVGEEVRLVDISADPPVETVLGQGAVVAGVSGPDGCLYMTSGDTVYKLSRSGGGCSFAPTGVTPALVLALTGESPGAVQGGSKSFRVELQKAAVPADTPAVVTVSGANPQSRLVRFDAAGSAEFQYSAAFAGDDRIVAEATIDGTVLTSNRLRASSAAGKHTAFLSLNPSPVAAAQEHPVNVAASLTDASVQPVLPLAFQTVDFTLDGNSCTAQTDQNGLAICTLSPQTPGNAVLTAHFAGTGEILAADASAGFSVMAATAGLPLPAVSLSLPAAEIIPGDAAEITWSSSNATACSAGGSWSGVKPVKGKAHITLDEPGNYTFTLSCSGAGGTAGGSAVAKVRPVASGPGLCDTGLTPNQGSGQKIRGTRDADDIMGTTGNDKIAGRRGNDRLYGADGADKLQGGGGGDLLCGGPGRDRLRGGPGGDVLAGGADADILAGGGGPDIYNFEAGGGGSDEVRGFDRKDWLVFRDANGDGAVDRQDVTLSETRKGTLVSFNDGSGDQVLLRGIKAARLDFALKHDPVSGGTREVILRKRKKS